MTEFNLDELLAFKTESYEYAERNGKKDEVFSQQFGDPVEVEMFYKNYRGTDLYDSFLIGGWEAGNAHRVECGGPLVEGPHAWMSKRGVAITAHKQPETRKVRVTFGDVLIIKGTRYVVTDGGRWKGVQLIAEEK